MALSIVTNVASLLAQDNLRITGDFQQKTIQRLTSGLRINSSADDAAGLAMANSFRSDVAVLQQGIRNAGDGMSTLQTIDGGINNVSLLLDRARTLATQSASGTFTGDRSTLNTEFSSVLNEIDRQAQAVGLDQGGLFATALSVFIGGGRGHTGAASSVAIANGSVSIDLSNSAIAANSLGLKGMQAMGGTSGTTDIGTGSASTSVEDIVGNATNTASERVSGFTGFSFSGPGFGDTSKIQVSVSLTGVVDSTTLATAINAAIESAGNGTSAAAAAFKAAGIEAVINTDSTGKQQLTFTSSTGAFQVEAGDRLANALLGNYTSSSDPTGNSIAVTRTGAAVVAAGPADATVNVVAIKIGGGGLTSAQTVTINITANATIGAILSNLTTLLAANTTLVAAGFTLTNAAGAAPAAGSQLVVNNSRGEKFEVAVSGDVEDLLGWGTARIGAGNAATYTSLVAAGAADATLASTGTISVLVEGAGGSVIDLTATGAAGLSAQNLADQFNTDIANSATLMKAGLQVTVAGGILTVISNNSTNFQLAIDETVALLTGYGTVGTASISVGTLASLPTELTFNSGGAQATSGTLATDPTAFTPLYYGSDVQNLVFTANDSSGTAHSLSVALTHSNASTLDQAVNAINNALQQSNDSTLNKIVAVKERLSNSAEGIRFLSGLAAGFKVGIGDTFSGNGVSDTTAVLTSAALSGGSVADIASQANAQTAVSTLATAVSLLAAAQANVGKGQNQLQFAIGLAATQVNNISVAQGRIRDADMAAEAANLTRASIALQAGIAALAQANSAPQTVLALLRG